MGICKTKSSTEETIRIDKFTAKITGTANNKFFFVNLNIQIAGNNPNITALKKFPNTIEKKNITK